MVVAWAVLRVGGLRRNAARDAAGGLGGTVRTAAEHRAEADRLATEGDWAEAVLERFRAVSRALEEDAVLVPQPGRTADEVAREAGAWLPGLSADLAAGAQLFDGVRYGGRPAGPDADTSLRALDAAVGRAQSVTAAR